jgi:hypothetical protein
VKLAAPIVPDCEAEDDLSHGVISNGDGIVALNLFQQDWDDWGWCLPGAPLWIPRPVLPKGP